MHLVLHGHVPLVRDYDLKRQNVKDSQNEII